VSLPGSVTGFTDITGFTITMSAKKTLRHTPMFTKTATIVSGPACTFVFVIAQADTAGHGEGEYLYDVKVVDGSGNPMHTVRSTFNLKAPVT
jgi:hypothetical protein